jgi:hypothetical protein
MSRQPAPHWMESGAGASELPRAAIHITACGSCCLQLGYGKEEEHCVVAALRQARGVPISGRLFTGSNRFRCSRQAPSSFSRASWRRALSRVESGEVRVLLPTGQSQKQLLDSVGPRTMPGLSEGMSGEVRVLLPAGQSQKQLLDFVGPRTMPGLSEGMSGERASKGRRPSFRASSSWSFCANPVISA